MLPYKRIVGLDQKCTFKPFKPFKIPTTTLPTKLNNNKLDQFSQTYKENTYSQEKLVNEANFLIKNQNENQHKNLVKDSKQGQNTRMNQQQNNYKKGLGIKKENNQGGNNENKLGKDKQNQKFNGLVKESEEEYKTKPKQIVKKKVKNQRNNNENAKQTHKIKNIQQINNLKNKKNIYEDQDTQSEKENSIYDIVEDDQDNDNTEVNYSESNLTEYGSDDDNIYQQLSDHEQSQTYENARKDNNYKRKYNEVFTNQINQLDKKIKTNKIICYSSLANDNKDILYIICSQIPGFIIDENNLDNFTHLIIQTNKRTLKVVYALARRCWILSAEFLYQSLGKSEWINEQDAESKDYPSKSIRDQVGPLFKGMDFYVQAGEYQGINQIELAKIIQTAGGNVKHEISEACIAIYDKKTSPKVRLADSQNIPILDYHWVLDSLTKYILLNQDQQY